MSNLDNSPPTSPLITDKPKPKEKIEDIKDTETEGIDVHTKKLLLAQFGCFDFQIVVDCRTIDITHYKDLLERKDKLFLF